LNRPHHYVLATIVTIMLVVGVVVGGYQLGWWLNSQSVNRNARIQQDSYGRQSALTTAVLREATDLQDPNLPPAQRVALVAEFCINASMLTGTIHLPAATQALITKECS